MPPPACHSPAEWTSRQGQPLQKLLGSLIIEVDYQLRPPVVITPQGEPMRRHPMLARPVGNLSAHANRRINNPGHISRPFLLTLAPLDHQPTTGLPHLVSLDDQRLPRSLCPKPLWLN